MIAITLISSKLTNRQSRGNAMVATIKDIAKRAGVSTATVSRVINDIGGYGTETRDRVLQAAKDLGYYKNETATSLVTNKTKTIGIIIPNVSTNFYGNIVNGIEDVAYEHGYSVILTHAGIEGNRLGDSLKLMANRRVDGVIIVSIYLGKKQQELITWLNLPTILLSTQAEGDTLPYIKVDDYQAIYQATQYMIDHHHPTIGLVGINDTDKIAGLPRLKGYLDCLKQHNRPIDRDYIVFGDFSFDAGVAAMQQFLKQKKIPSAIVCASDETAMGVKSVAYENGLTIPDDLSIIGYDDTSIAWMSSPPLTTIGQPFYEMGAKGCERVIKAIADNCEMVSEIVPFKLMVRKTVKTLNDKPC